jgi:hypothetical protein
MLPIDIWIYIFDEFSIRCDVDSLKSCALVCSELREPSQATLFRDRALIIGSPSRAKSAIELLCAPSSLSKHIHWLSLDYEADDWVLIQEFGQVLPVLRKLTLRGATVDALATTFPASPTFPTVTHLTLVLFRILSADAPLVLVPVLKHFSSLSELSITISMFRHEPDKRGNVDPSEYTTTRLCLRHLKVYSERTIYCNSWTNQLLTLADAIQPGSLQNIELCIRGYDDPSLLQRLLLLHGASICSLVYQVTDPS